MRARAAAGAILFLLVWTICPQAALAEAGAPAPSSALVAPPSATSSMPYAVRRSLQTVVLDPGHGGEQKGAEGKGGLVEKEVTLDIARRVQSALRQAGLNAILTRDSDLDVTLDERTAIANREKADVFISIHVNAAARRDARGAETFYLAYQAADQETRDLAASENAFAIVEPPRPEGDIDLVLWDMAQAEHLRESSELAEILQKELNEALGVRDRGVKQAPFHVLMGATMPAVLVEVGFASNPAEEASLKTDEYRNRLAASLARGIARFKESYDRRQGAVLR